MRRAAVVIGATALAGFVVALALSMVRDGNDPAQMAQGGALYAQYCAACHGANLEGQPNWKERRSDGRLPAPPHDETGHTWHHSDRQLVAITKFGPEALIAGYESDMPGFAEVLSDAEISAVLAFIKSNWPEREREFQAARSSADAG